MPWVVVKWMLLVGLLFCPIVALADEQGTDPPASLVVEPAIAPTTPANEAFAKLSKAEQDTLKEAVVAYNQGIASFQAAQQAAALGQRGEASQGFRAAEGHFKAALKFNPTLVEAQSNVAYVALAQQRYPQAVKAFKQALKLEPKHGQSLLGLATALTQQLPLFTSSEETTPLNKKQTQWRDEALIALEEVQNLYPQQALAWYNQGSLWQRLAQLPQAETAYLQALERDPSLQQAWFNLATLYEATQHWDDAQRAYQHAKQVGVATPLGLEALKRLEGLPQRKALSSSSTSSPSTPDDTP